MVLVQRDGPAVETRQLQHEAVPAVVLRPPCVSNRAQPEPQVASAARGTVASLPPERAALRPADRELQRRDVLDPGVDGPAECDVGQLGRYRARKIGGDEP